MRSLMLMLGAACLLTGCGKKPKEEAKNTGGGDSDFVAVDGARMVTGRDGQSAPQPAPQPVDNRNTAYRPGSTVLGSTYRAGKRAALLSEMSQIGTMVFQTVQLDDRMPSAAEIKADLQKEAPKYAKLVDEGVIILTGTTDKKGLWAYEVDADKAGGIALVAGRASRMTADEITALLAKK